MSTKQHEYLSSRLRNVDLNQMKIFNSIYSEQNILMISKPAQIVIASKTPFEQANEVLPGGAGAGGAAGFRARE